MHIHFLLFLLFNLDAVYANWYNVDIWLTTPEYLCGSGTGGGSCADEAACKTACLADDNCVGVSINSGNAAQNRYFYGCSGGYSSSNSFRTVYMRQVYESNSAVQFQVTRESAATTGSCPSPTRLSSTNSYNVRLCASDCAADNSCTVFTLDGTSQRCMLYSDCSTINTANDNFDIFYNPQTIGELSSAPTASPTTPPPSKSPTQAPTPPPSQSPTKAPTETPPSESPTLAPTEPGQTLSPTNSPTTAEPTRAPTKPGETFAPTRTPTKRPTNEPTSGPTAEPTERPTTPFPTTAAPTPPERTITDTIEAMGIGSGIVLVSFISGALVVFGLYRSAASAANPSSYRNIPSRRRVAPNNNDERRPRRKKSPQRRKRRKRKKKKKKSDGFLSNFTSAFTRGDASSGSESDND